MNTVVRHIILMVISIATGLLAGLNIEKGSYMWAGAYIVLSIYSLISALEDVK